MTTVPALRIQPRNSRAPRRDGDYVLYWMIANRRVRSNFALDRALHWARELDRPLLVLEALRSDYRWASDRHHRFVLDGMAANERACAAANVAYWPYVEPRPGAGRGLLEALSQRAAVVVTDDHPTFFLPRMVEAAAARLPVLLEAVDANGLLPLRAADEWFPTAYAFRRFLQRTLPRHLHELPLIEPLELARGAAHVAEVDGSVAQRWPRASAALLAGDASLLARLPIDHDVPVVARPGGAEAAHAALREFLERRLASYADDRNDPSVSGASGFSPYLHFGHLGTHEIFRAIAAQEGWTPEHLATSVRGKRAGWWNMSPAAEAFLDQLVTWRELGFNFAAQRVDRAAYTSLPAWAKDTLAAHADDPRAHVYSLEEFERSHTHDPVWNAAQRELVREGRIHNYLRMLWGKKILEWTRRPEDALAVMIELNDRHALDGRDPNSLSGIFWVLGRFDRPWGPVRPIFGTVRYMSSENTARKLDLDAYLARYAPTAAK